LILVEIPLDESYDASKDPQSIYNEFKQKLSQRKDITCVYLTKLQFFSFKEQKTLCGSFPLYRIIVEYSDENLFKLTNDHNMLRSGIANNNFPSSQQFQNFLFSMTQALFTINMLNMTHGFVMPINILIFNKSSQKPLFKLVDVSLISRYQSCYEKLLHDKDALCPLDPNLMKNYEKKNYNIIYESHDDVWALGISALCFLFNEDFNSFYDWSKCRVKTDKINTSINTLYEINYNPIMIKLVTQMLDINEITRIKLGTLLEYVKQA